MSSEAREALATAQENANKAYDDWMTRLNNEKTAWLTLGYGDSKTKLDINKIKSLITKNWKTITAVGAAFGVPIGIADSGSFNKVFDLLSNFWPF